jgi:hypothetical protein
MCADNIAGRKSLFAIEAGVDSVLNGFIGDAISINLLRTLATDFALLRLRRRRAQRRETPTRFRVLQLHYGGNQPLATRARASEPVAAVPPTASAD